MSNVTRSLICSIAIVFLTAGFTGKVAAQSASSDCFVPNGTPGCDNAYCETAVCDLDPFCCNNFWDPICAGLDPEISGARDVCPGDCLATGHGAGCSNPTCETTVCAIDSSCCNTDWNSTCVDQALASCGFPSFELGGTDFCFPIVAKNGKVAVTCLGPDLLEPLDANPPTNTPPTITNLPDQTITLPPTNTVSLTPTVTDDGLPAPSMLTYNWALTGGTPALIAEIVSPTSQNTDVVFIKADDQPFTFELTVSDGELESSDSVQVTVLAPVPDLIVDTVSVTNSTPDTDESFTINATVRNQGAGASAITTLRYYQSTDNVIDGSDMLVGTDEVAALSPGGTSPESMPVAIATAGTYYVGACVNAVAGESPTDNQCSSPGVLVQVTCGGTVLDPGEECIICAGLEMVSGDGIADSRDRTLGNCPLPPAPPSTLDHTGFTTCGGCH